MIRPPHRFTLFPYTTLFRSSQGIPEAKIETIFQGKDHQLDVATVKRLHEQNPSKPSKPLGNVQDLVWAYNRRVDLVLRSEEHTSELQSLRHLVCRLLLEKKK